MAYVEKLIGKWEDDHFEPQRDVAKNIFRTNWNKLENDYQLLKDKVETNERIARAEYADALVNTQRNSLNRMNAVASDLAERGLASGGYSDRYLKADIGQKGQEVDTELGRLLANNQENVGNLLDASIGMNATRLNLTDGFLKDLADITTAKGQNAQDYADLYSSLSESAANRAVTNADRHKEDETKRIYRFMHIIDTVNSTEYTDEEKLTILMQEANVPREEAVSLLRNKKYKEEMDNIAKKQQLIAQNNYTYGKENLGSLYRPIHSGFRDLLNFFPQNSINKSYENLANYELGDLSNYTYQDINKLLEDANKSRYWYD